MKMKLKKIVIFLALMVLAGSVFVVDIIRSKRIGQYEIRVTYVAGLGYNFGILDNHNYNLFVTDTGLSKSVAIETFNMYKDFTPSQVKSALNLINWSYVGESGGYSIYY